MPHGALGHDSVSRRLIMINNKIILIYLPGIYNKLVLTLVVTALSLLGDVRFMFTKQPQLENCALFILTCESVIAISFTPAETKIKINSIISQFSVYQSTTF